MMLLYQNVVNKDVINVNKILENDIEQGTIDSIVFVVQNKCLISIYRSLGVC